MHQVVGYSTPWEHSFRSLYDRVCPWTTMSRFSTLSGKDRCYLLPVSCPSWRGVCSKASQWLCHQGGIWQEGGVRLLSLVWDIWEIITLVLNANRTFYVQNTLGSICNKLHSRYKFVFMACALKLVPARSLGSVLWSWCPCIAPLAALQLLGALPPLLFALGVFT